MKDSQRILKPALWLILSIISASCMSFYVAKIWSANQPPHFSDLYAPWWGAHELFLHGRNPYALAVAHEIQTVIYGALPSKFARLLPRHQSHAGCDADSYSNACAARPTAAVARLLVPAPLPRSPLAIEAVSAASAYRGLASAGMAVGRRNRFNIGSHPAARECVAPVVGRALVHQPAIAVGSPVCVRLPDSNPNQANRSESRSSTSMTWPLLVARDCILCSCLPAMMRPV